MSTISHIMFDYHGTIREAGGKNFLAEAASLAARRASLLQGERSRPVVPGIKEVLLALANTHTLSLNSASSLKSIQEFLHEHHLEHIFGTILSGDDNTSKADKMNDYILKQGLAPEECLFVTDSSDDIEEAHQAGVSVVGVSWGITTKTDLLKVDPLAVFDKPADLLAWIQQQ